MKNWIQIISLAFLLFLFSAGCDEFWQKGDELVQDANAVAGGARALLDSPAGQLVPPDLKLCGLLGISLINGVVIGWEEWRNRMKTKTMKAIVKGIENTGNPDKTTSEVKDNIAEAKRNQGSDKI